MKKAYIVTSGEYSDYRIKAVFSTKESAETYAKAYSDANQYPTAEVEEWDLDSRPLPYAAEKWVVGLRLKDGSLYMDHKVDAVIEGPDDESSADSNGFNVWGYSTKSRDHAMKLAAEHRQAILRETPPRI